MEAGTSCAGIVMGLPMPVRENPAGSVRLDEAIRFECVWAANRDLDRIFRQDPKACGIEPTSAFVKRLLKLGCLVCVRFSTNHCEQGNSCHDHINYHAAAEPARILRMLIWILGALSPTALQVK